MLTKVASLCSPVLLASLLLGCEIQASFSSTPYPPTESAQIASVKAHYAFDGQAALPDKTVTPGQIRTSSTQEVCHGGSTKQFRHTTQAEKDQVYRWYGAVKEKGKCCEVDHLISLELGGSDELGNLWPEPYEPRPGAHEKDEVENWLHSQVCSGKMKLTDAQTQVAQDWFLVYQKMPHLVNRTK